MEIFLAAFVMEEGERGVFFSQGLGRMELNVVFLFNFIFEVF